MTLLEERAESALVILTLGSRPAAHRNVVAGSAKDVGVGLQIRPIRVLDQHPRPAGLRRPLLEMQQWRCLFAFERSHAEERSLSRQRARLQDRIDFIRAGGGGSASTSQVEEQLQPLLEKERALSQRRNEMHSQISELQQP